MKKYLFVSTLMACTTILIASAPETISNSPHLKNIKQITFGDVNGEAYFSFDSQYLIFQSTRGGRNCFQEYITDLNGSFFKRVSTDEGATTCGFFLPGDQKVLFSSSHAVSPECPAIPPKTGKYVWPLYNYDIYVNDLQTGKITTLTSSPGYDAEATVAPDGSQIVFTSTRDGDIEIYSMNLDGSHVRRLTYAEGYDGGPVYSPDSKRIAYRAYHPTEPGEIKSYRELLAQNLVEPSKIELYVMNADGSDQHPITQNGAANFAPFFAPDGRHIIFSSNLGNTQGRAFELYLMSDDGTKIEQITANGAFNSFPMFSPDGKKLVWISSFDAKTPGEANIFVADWID